MPGSVANAAPTAVLPSSLCRSFVHSREYPVQVNEYRNGESQRGRLADTSRKSWRIGKRLTPTELVTLRDFYDVRRGPQEPFYFYDPWETAPKFSYDPTGTATDGRYTVRFEGAWQQSSELSRIEVEIALVEVA
jgi:hypothetical protein